MIFIIDIDCCVFLVSRGLFFVGMGLCRWGLAFEGQVGFGRLDRFFCWLKWIKWNCLLSLLLESGLARIDIEIYWNILKSLWRLLRRSVCCWRPSSTMGRSETVQRCKSQQEVGGEIPRKWNVYAVCDLYVLFCLHGVLIRTWTYSCVSSIQTKRQFSWAKTTYDPSPLLARRCSQTCRTSPVRRRVLAAGFPPSRAGTFWGTPKPLLCFLWSTPEIQFPFISACLMDEHWLLAKFFSPDLQGWGNLVITYLVTSKSSYTPSLTSSYTPSIHLVTSCHFHVIFPICGKEYEVAKAVRRGRTLSAVEERRSRSARSAAFDRAKRWTTKPKTNPKWVIIYDIMIQWYNDIMISWYNDIML